MFSWSKRDVYQSDNNCLILYLWLGTQSQDSQILNGTLAQRIYFLGLSYFLIKRKM